MPHARASEMELTRSRHTVCVQKWPEAQADRVASVHVFSSQEGAETIPRAGVVFLSSVGTARPKGIPLVDQRTEICVISLKIFISGVRETEMIADPKRKPYQDDGDGDKRRRQEEALDEALENTFPASDPVSVEQPTTSGRAYRS